MADLTVPLVPGRQPPANGRDGREGEPIWDIIELLFFAYRDFVGDPDEVLVKFGFGRAHHRVLHFVNRNPGAAATLLRRQWWGRTQTLPQLPTMLRICWSSMMIAVSAICCRAFCWGRAIESRPRRPPRRRAPSSPACGSIFSSSTS